MTVAINSRITTEVYTGFAATSDYDAPDLHIPAEAVSQLLSTLNIRGAKGTRIANPAAGAGKFTEHLAARHENFKIIAVEHENVMREELIKTDC